MENQTVESRFSKNTPLFSTRDLTLTALMVALLSISSYIVIPLPFSAVSITAQTLVINLIALLFSPKQAGTAVFVWILIGAAGVPVFSGGAGGLGKLTGPTGGYIAGYLAAAILISLLKGKKRNLIRYCLVTILAGIPVIYLLGTVWYKYSTGAEGWMALITATVLPFIPLDIVKCVAASLLAKPLGKVVEKG